MKYKPLGRLGVMVSRLALGTMNFGTHTPEAQAHEIMSRAVERGVNLLDTANVYGPRLGEGVTESIVGRWLAQDRRRRDEIVLATKVYGLMGRKPNNGRLTALHIRRAVEDSLNRLQTDRLDLLQLHHIDRATPWEETWQALELLVAQGKVIYVGSSNFAGWHLARAQEQAARRGFMGLVSESSVYNLMERTVELEVLPACREYGIGLLPYSPLNRGLLAGPAEPGEAGRRASEPRGAQLREAAGERLAAFARWCDAFGEAPAKVALAWLTHQPDVTAPVLGPRTLEQLDAGLQAVRLRMEPEQLKELDAMFPGPGGPAPEAYAW